MVADRERHSVYCFATDILDEGAGAVLDNIQYRAGLASVTVAAKYHAATDVFPHNPARKLATLAPGVFYRPDAARYRSAALRPIRSPLAEGRDVLDEVCSTAAPRGMAVGAWVVLLHHDEAPSGGDWLQVNCFGDKLAGALCPAAPEVRYFAEQVVDEVAAYPVHTVRLESPHYHGVGHGQHHERLLEPYGEVGLFLLGLCFCNWCTQKAQGAGVDTDQLAWSARSSLEKLFHGSLPAAAFSTEVLVDLCGEGALAYQEVRKQVVTALVAHLADVARRRGPRLCVIDQAVAAQSYASGSIASRSQRPAWEFALDLGGIRESGARAEVTAYLSDPEELQATLSWYRDQTSGDMAVILRPGPPDSASTEELGEKLGIAAAVQAPEVNFYAYGLYRLGVLDRIASALASSPGTSA